MKYRKKQEIVEAVQWFKPGDYPYEDQYLGSTLVKIRNLGAQWEVFPGCWIIECQDNPIVLPNEFRATYEPVETERKPYRWAVVHPDFDPQMSCAYAHLEDAQHYASELNNIDKVDYKVIPLYKE